MEQHDFHFMLTAADCGPEREITLDKLSMLLIETATAHANRLGVGFATLITSNLAWVLSRMSVELSQPMEVNTAYRFDTWVESLNRMFSERNFAVVRESDNQIIGYARTVWMVLDMDTRRPGDLTQVQALADAVNPRECPIAKCAKLLPVSGEDVQGYDYTFMTSDIDINRHVATRRYIDLLVSCLPMDYWHENRLQRLDIAFKHEGRYGQTACMKIKPIENDAFNLEIAIDGVTSTLAKMKFVKR